MSRIEEIRERAQRADQLVMSRDDTPALGMTTRTYAADVAYLLERVEELEAENEMWRRVWEAMEEKLEQAPLGEEPLAFWGGYRAALLDMRDLAARESLVRRSRREIGTDV